MALRPEGKVIPQTNLLGQLRVLTLLASNQNNIWCEKNQKAVCQKYGEVSAAGINIFVIQGPSLRRVEKPTERAGLSVECICSCISVRLIRSRSYYRCMMGDKYSLALSNRQRCGAAEEK